MPVNQFEQPHGSGNIDSGSVRSQDIPIQLFLPIDEYQVSFGVIGGQGANEGAIDQCVANPAPFGGIMLGPGQIGRLKILQLLPVAGAQNECATDQNC